MTDQRADSKILRICYSNLPISIHPHLVSDTGSHTISKALFEGLTRINPQGKVTLALAENMRISSFK